MPLPGVIPGRGPQPKKGPGAIMSIFELLPSHGTRSGAHLSAADMQEVTAHRPGPRAQSTASGLATVAHVYNSEYKKEMGHARGRREGGMGGESHEFVVEMPIGMGGGGIGLGLIGRVVCNFPVHTQTLARSSQGRAHSSSLCLACTSGAVDLGLSDSYLHLSARVSGHLDPETT